MTLGYWDLRGGLQQKGLRGCDLGEQKFQIEVLGFIQGFKNVQKREQVTSVTTHVYGAQKACT